MSASRYLSVHIYFPASVYSPFADAVIERVIAPITRRLEAASLTAGHFFIRYTDTGPHVRLRLRPTAGSEPRIMEVVSDVLAHADPRLLAVGTGGGTAVVGRGFEARWIAYEPEVERYGGVDGLPVAESSFEDSSAFAIDSLPVIGGGTSSRLGRGLLGMLLHLHTFADGHRERIRQLADWYREAYLPSAAMHASSPDTDLRRAFDAAASAQSDALRPIVHSILEALDAGEVGPPEVDRFYARLRSTRLHCEELVNTGRFESRYPHGTPWQRAVGHLLPSLLHMNNNRLGISIPAETYLGHVIGRAISP